MAETAKNVISYKEIYGRIFATILYRIWLYRKRHYLITVLQIIMPPLILFTLLSVHSSIFRLRHEDIVGDFNNNYQKYTEKDLFNSICQPNCDNGKTTIISYVTPSEYPTQFIEALEKHSFQPLFSASTFKFIKLKTEEDMLKLAVLHHIKNLHYVGGIVFTTLNFNNSTFQSLLSSNSNSSTNNISSSSGSDTGEKPIYFDLSFKIRMVKFIPSELSSFGSFNLDDSNLKYYLPFMGLQLAVTRALLYYSHNGSFTDPLKLALQGFPSPPLVQYHFITTENTYQFVSISLVLGLTFVVYSLIRAPCSDQETKFKPYLHMMGFPRWSYWLCWILNGGIVQSIAVGLQITLLFIKANVDAGSLVKHGSPTIWSIFLLLYACAAISFFTFIASFFKRGILGTYVAATIWLLSYYFADLFLPSYILAISWFAKLAMCLVPNAALIWGITIMASNPGGISFENIFHRLDKNGISLFEIMLVLGSDIIIFYTLTFMLDRVQQGLVTRKPWYSVFKSMKKSAKHLICCCTCQCNCNCKKQGLELKIDINPNELSKTSLSQNDSSEYFSSTFTKNEAIILTEKLTKVYYNKTIAIDSADLRVQVGKCSTIVGHHGAGKSTLVNLLCGEVSPSEGTIKICGYDIRKDKTKIQALISVCPTLDVLCYDMTMIQHLIFIGKLKGMTHSQASDQANLYLQKLELTKKTHKFPDDLLEIEKRKLCIIMAFMGNSKIVILDEPTKEIEEDMHKIIWDFILSFTGDKTILVFTFSMAEGYYLGNRVNVLSNGKIVASGTPVHLEKTFGTGYHLKLKVNSTADKDRIKDLILYHTNTASTLSAPTGARLWRAMSLSNPSNDELAYSDLTNLERMENSIELVTQTSGVNDTAKRVEIIVEDLRKIPKPVSGTGTPSGTRSTVTSTAGGEEGTEDIEILLPLSEVSQFSELFSLLENRNVLAKLGILKWRVDLYQIDRAFKEANEYIQLANEEVQTTLAETEIAIMNNLLADCPKEKLTGFWLGTQRFKALLIKRIMWTYGVKIYTLVQIFTPIILLILAIQGTNPLFHSQLEKSEHEIMMANFPRQIVLIKNISDRHNFSHFYESILANRDLIGLRLKERIERNLTSFRPRIESTEDPIGALSGQFITGLEINNENVTAMFSPLAYHAGPISFSVLLNTYLKFMFPEDDIRISVTSHPIQNNTKEMLKFYLPYDALIDGDDEILSFAVILGFGLFVLCTGFTTQPVAERVWLIKRLQMNTSLSKFSYWISFILCDWLVIILVSHLLLVVMQRVPDHQAFSDKEFGGYFVGFYILAGYSSIILCYNASFLFRRANTCFYGMLSFNQFAGIFVFILAITIQVGPTINTLFRFILEVLIQPYCIPAGFYSLISLAIQNNKCQLLSKTVKSAICNESFIGEYQLDIKFKTSTENVSLDLSCCKCHYFGNCSTKSLASATINSPPKQYLHFYDEFNSERLWLIFCVIAFQSVALTVFLVLMQIGLVENCVRRKFYKPIKKSTLLASNRGDEHESVRVERELVEKILEQDPVQRQNHLIINLTSPTFIRSRQILSEIQLCCSPGSCTTIYGPNGSGKTIFLKILSRIKACKHGKICWNENELLFGDGQQIESFLSQIGYCPENINALYSKLSGLQLIRLFGRLRGIPEKHLTCHVNKWLQLFSFTARANEDYKFYSESMKRKLFIILALIGDSKLLLLDNPTQNLDPVSKYQFWTVIHYLVNKEKRTVVITTSRAEDLEKSKCDKLVVLVNGKVQHITSPQDFMNTFGKGYTIIVSLKSKPDVRFEAYVHLKERIEKDLVGSVLEEEQPDLLHYNIPTRETQRWSEIFQLMEEIKYDYQLIINSYTVRETLLEDILHVLATKQIPCKIVTNSLDEFCLQFC